MRILALAYVYPPDAGSGTYRTLYFFNRLARDGDAVTLMTAREEDFAPGATVDRELIAKVHLAIRVVRARVRRPVAGLLKLKSSWLGAPASPAAGPMSAPQPVAERRGPWQRCFSALKDTVTGSLTFPDEHVGWIPDVLKQGGREIRSQRIECLYSSGGPWTSHVAAALLKKRHGLPLVLDFRDPWASNPDLAGRSPLARGLIRRLERFCIAAADRVICNTEPLRADFIRRYPTARADKFITVTNGFENLEPVPVGPRNERFTLVHAGEIYLSRNPAAFLRAVSQLLKSGALKREELRVRLIGGCSRNAEIEALLASAELHGTVELLPRVSHRVALEYQREADALLLFQTGFPLQVPRKLFEYLSLRKPVLAVTEPGSATAEIIADSGVGVVAQQDADSLSAALLTLYTAWRERRGTATGDARIEKYRNDRLAEELRATLLAAIRGGGPPAIGPREYNASDLSARE